jgi:hypothetical protein
MAQEVESVIERLERAVALVWSDLHDTKPSHMARCHRWI